MITEQEANKRHLSTFDLSQDRYAKLLRRGRELFAIDVVGGEINVLCNKFIRSDSREYRRESDFNEICIALAVLEENMQVEKHG